MQTGGRGRGRIPNLEPKKKKVNFRGTQNLLPCVSGEEAGAGEAGDIQSGASVQGGEGHDKEQVSYHCQEIVLKPILPEGHEIITITIAPSESFRKKVAQRFLGGVMYI